MKLTIFYSWQSDLPNNENRSFIEVCLEKSLKKIYERNPAISEYIILSDSRNEKGTPDLVSSIFKKIDECDIFLADISIVNSEQSNSDINRKTPNFNVLIELGYAAKSIGWEQIICVFNRKYGKIEESPFDIRFRKPLFYDTSNNTEEKNKLTSSLISSIEEIIKNAVLDKRLYLKTKRKIDLGMQAILFDFSRLFFDNDATNRYNYSLVLNSSKEDLFSYLNNKEFLGFKIYKNILLNITEFDDFFTKEINTFFLTSTEKKIIVKLIYILRDYYEFLTKENIINITGEKDESLFVISDKKLGKSNPSHLCMLMEKINNEKAIVLDSGEFEDRFISCLLNKYSFDERGKDLFCNLVLLILQTIKEWIEETGKYFIVNERLLGGSKITDN